MEGTGTHAQERMETAAVGRGRYAAVIGGGLIGTLVVLFLLSTVFGRKDRGNDAPPALMQTSTLEPDSAGTDSIPLQPDVRITEEDPPRFWLQARGSSGGNAAWGPDIVPPYDTLWRLGSSGGREFFSAPALVENTLYFGANDGSLRAVNALTGAVEWSFSTICGICGEPAADSSAVYFGGQDGYVYALDRFSGAKKWSSGLGYHVFCDTGIMEDSLILSGNSMGRICALHRDTGQPVWDGEIGGVVLGPAVLGSTAVFTSESGAVVMVDRQGSKLWSRNYDSQASSPSADSSGVYAGFSSGTVRKFSLETGELLWETVIVGGRTRCVLSRPVIAGERLLVGTNDGQLVCLSTSTGVVLWRQQFDNWIQLPPAAGEELVYMACDDQRLHVVDLDTGMKVDSLEMGGYAGTAPLLNAGILYYGNTSGDFLAMTGVTEAEETFEEHGEPPDRETPEESEEGP